MKVYVYPADVYGCGYYRLIWPTEVLVAHGHDVVITLPGDTTGLGLKRSILTGEFDNVIYPADADVVVFQRPSHPHLVRIIELLRQHGVAVVVDVDDDLNHIHPSNPAWAHMHPRSLTNHSWADVAKACRLATLVTVSTPRLTEVYGKHGRVHVLDNYVPGGYLDIEHHDATWIGWPGSTHSHPTDLSVMGSSIGNLIADGIPFRVVGSATGAGKQLGLIVDPNETGPVPFEDWPEAVAAIGIGVAPLSDTVFNASKSRLKLIELSALGVPWVASPRVEYARMHALGCGLLAERSREWERALRTLVTNENQRREMSEKGRAVAATLTIEEHAWRWMEAWERARTIQDRKR